MSGMATTTIPEFNIDTIERRTKPGRMASLVFGTPGTPDTEGWYARVTSATGASVDLSKLDGEDTWTIDAAFGPTGLPSFMNGFGARYLATRHVQDFVANELDAQIRSASA